MEEAAITTMELALIDALKAARDYIKLRGHKATAWRNDPDAREIITEVIEPALRFVEASKASRTQQEKKL